MKAFDKLGVVIALLAAYATLIAPFVAFRPNRIVAGQPRAILDALPNGQGWLLFAIMGAAALVALLRTPASLRLFASLAALAALGALVGVAAVDLVPEGNSYARVSPASGFWIAAFAFALLAADALTRLALGPLARIGVLALIAAVLALALTAGIWDGLSVMKEYETRGPAFWREAGTHVVLALGSLAAAALVGLPLGIFCHRQPKLRAGVLHVLNIVQTIPSIALFGMLIAPLGWLAANVPLAAALGIRGIGMAPAFVALFLYSLLPVVANTVVGLRNVPKDADDAARGMGMTDRQRLMSVELPLAFPVILTGIRIVLVQNIGLATIAALIGGGGLGVFVFQGIGQTAMDLVLLGALPTVALAFAAAVILDAVVEMSQTPTRKAAPAGAAA
ncbi:ABC transporter permease [Marinivivus vitaminiproducens]|uniref:ABC transporter permease n=1 Tax=Marinivivus vitaminiproducens TaxID=3035935 RepID=UPI00279C8C18|nr:ABC transporter permease [Geminicoccaceae bacterium SCSIO 64248]